MDLLAPDFDLVRGRAAYDVAAVDEAVAEARRLLAGPPAYPPTVQGGFRLTEHEGYDARQVDVWRDAVRRELAAREGERWADDDPPELRGVTHHDGGEPASTTPTWVRLTALVLVVAVALFFVASYFV